MQNDIVIIGLIFPAIPLMMATFNNSHTVLAHLILHLHDEAIRDNVSPKDAECPLRIDPLRNRPHLIGIIQSCITISFALALGAMIKAYFDERLFAREIQIANTALKVHLPYPETHK